MAGKINNPPNIFLFTVISINKKIFFDIHHPTDTATHTTAFATPVVENRLGRVTKVRQNYK